MTTKVKAARYTHTPLNEDVEAFAGYYTPEKEVRLEFQGREILYVTGHVVIECTCGPGHACTSQNYWYATVPGYIIKWQSETNSKGYPVTEIEPVKELSTQAAIRKVINKKESVMRVDFW
jgi:hypothetical protein